MQFLALCLELMVGRECLAGVGVDIEIENGLIECEIDSTDLLCQLARGVGRHGIGGLTGALVPFRDAACAALRLSGRGGRGGLGGLVANPAGAGGRRICIIEAGATTGGVGLHIPIGGQTIPRDHAASASAEAAHRGKCASRPRTVRCAIAASSRAYASAGEAELLVHHSYDHCFAALSVRQSFLSCVVWGDIQSRGLIRQDAPDGLPKGRSSSVNRVPLDNAVAGS